MKKEILTIALIAGFAGAADAQTKNKETAKKDTATTEVVQDTTAVTPEKKKTRAGRFLKGVKDYAADKGDKLKDEWKTIKNGGVAPVDSTAAKPAAADSSQSKTIAPTEKPIENKAKVKPGAKDDKQKSATPTIDAIGKGLNKIIPKGKKH